MRVLGNQPDIPNSSQIINIKTGGVEMMGSFHAAVAVKATLCKNENGRHKVPIQLQNKAWTFSF